MEPERIAFLGLGVMGRGMVTNLVRGGHEVTVWNRTPAATERALAAGAHGAATPAAAVADAELIMYCLSDEAAVRAVVFGEEGVLAGARAGQVAVDMSTVHPSLSVAQAEAFEPLGVDFLDAPVFGSKDEAAAGGLWILVGGDQAVFDRVRPVLELLSETTHYMGGTGTGTAMKLVGNLIVAAQLEALGEALVLATKAGLDLEKVLGVLRVTDFRSPIFDSVGADLLRRDFSTSFALKHMLKDANLIARYAQELNVPTPAAAATREVIKAAVNQGWGEENASAMVRVLEVMGGREIGG